MNHLLRELLQVAHPVDHRVAEDWLNNTMLVARETLLLRGGAVNSQGLEQIVRRHIRRLGGFGGSDMAVLLVEHQGGFHPHGVTGGDIVRQKLCIDSPEVPRGDLERGIALESEIERKVMARLRAESPVANLKVPEALDSLNLRGGVPGHPWMRSEVDRVLILRGRRNILIDYKSPASEEGFDAMVNDPPVIYKAQLGHYRLNLEAAGIPIDEVMLAPFSYKRWDVELVPLEFDTQFDRELLAAGDRYWDFVLRGQIPERPLSKDFQYVREVPPRLRESMIRSMVAKKMVSVATKLDDAARAALLEEASIAGVDWDRHGMTTRLPGITISRGERETVAYKKAFEDLRSGELKPLAEYRQTVDTLTVALPRSKKSEHAPLIETLEAIAERAISLALEDAADAASPPPSPAALEPASTHHLDIGVK